MDLCRPAYGHPRDLSSLHPLARTLVSHLSGEESGKPASVEESPREVRKFIRRLAEHVASWSGKPVRFKTGAPSSTCGLVGPLPTAELLVEVLEAQRGVRPAAHGALAGVPREPAAGSATGPAGPAAAEIWRDHFRLAGDPFSLSPDPSVFYLSEGHSEALAALKVGLLESRGLIVAIGEVGTGKTTILYSLLADLDSRIETAYIANTMLPFDDLLAAALADFGVEVTGPRRIDLLDALNDFLYDCARRDKTVALVIDEAQNLSDETFEQVRLLLNFETYKKKLLQIVLVGQPELADRLARPQLRQLADRIAIRCYLNPLSSKDARRYIAYRLQAAGGKTEVFTRPALGLLVRKALGIPRRINLLAHNAMLFAFGEGLDRVDRSLVAMAVRERAGKGLVKLRHRGARRVSVADLFRGALTSRITWIGATAIAALLLTAIVAWSR